MAEKRMFSNKITQLDEFLDLPATSQNLYFHLNMDADDEGFVSSPKKVMRMIGASQRDLELLIQDNFIIGFNTGIVVIRHWNIHNTIRKDRIRITMYEEERANLSESGGVYDLMTDKCQPNVNQTTTKRPHRLDKIRLDKISIEEISIEKNIKEPFLFLSNSLGTEIKHVKITQDDMNVLVSKYSEPVVLAAVEEMDDWISANKKGKSPYTDYRSALHNWIKRNIKSDAPNHVSAKRTEIVPDFTQEKPSKDLTEEFDKLMNEIKEEQ